MAAASRTPTWRRRTIIIVAIAAAVFAVVYAAVVALYAANDRRITIDSCAADLPTDSLTMSFSPQSVDAAADRIVVTLEVLSFGPVEAADSGLSDTPLTIVVTDTDGPRSFDIAAGEIPSPLSLRFITDGQIEQWPFDRHGVDFAIVAIQNPGDDPRAVPVSLCGSAHVPGWGFASSQSADTGDLTIDGDPVTQLRVVASRSAATIAFGIVILVMLAVLPVLALIVAVLAFRGDRKVEATLTSWMAAMLFATVPLRTFLPGSPPVGSWVDYLVVLWVVAGLVLALALYVSAWVRWAPAGGRVAAGVVPVPVPVRTEDETAGAGAARSGDGVAGAGAAGSGDGGDGAAAD